mmetsp:Transcript_25053/g.34960  ORF Transcript_25053/g.34960 Transcript_25053/m.34960 type:complete len:180 (+) Transcript_25053:501-1040(+)
MDGKSMCLLRCVDQRINVSELVTRVMRDALATRKHYTRFTHRVLPMSHTCFSKMEELMPILDEAITEFFSTADELQHQNDEKEKTFAVVIKNRGAKNKHMNRMDIINYIVPKMPEGYTVNLDNPLVTVMVQIIGRVTGVCVIRDFKMLSEFNVRSLLAKNKKPDGTSVENVTAGTHCNK